MWRRSLYEWIGIVHLEAKGDKKRIALKAIMATCPTQLDKKSRDLKDFTEYFCTAFVNGLIETFRLLARAISVNSFNYRDADELHVHASKKRFFSSSPITTAHHAWFTKHFNLINAQLTHFLLLWFGNTRKREIIKSPTLCHPKPLHNVFQFLRHSSSSSFNANCSYGPTTAPCRRGQRRAPPNLGPIIDFAIFSRSRLLFSRALTNKRQRRLGWRWRAVTASN